MAARLTAYLVSLIVAATLIAGLIVGAQNDGDAPVDLIVYNGKVYRGPDEPPAEAVAVRGDRILRVGSNWEVRRLRRRQTHLVDARGGTVLPGFNEAHARVVEGGLSLDEGAQTLLEPVVPQHSRARRLQAIRNAIAEAHRFGITSIQDTAAGAEDLELYEQLRAKDELTVRVYAVLAVRAGLTDEDAARLDAVRKQYPDDPLLKTGGVRLTVNDLPTFARQNRERAAVGTPDRHASLELPGQAGSNAPSGLTPAELNRIIALMDRRGWQVVAHAPSDDAASMALDAFLHAVEVNRPGAPGRRHRIELDVPLADVDWRRFESLGLLADLPSSAASFLELFDASDHVLLSSRWPRDSLDPLPTIFAAADTESDAYALAAAIDAYTRAPAYASFDDKRKGIIAPDMLADLVVLSTDIFSLPPDQLAESVVEVTIFDGRVVYTRGKSDSQTE